MECRSVGCFLWNPSLVVLNVLNILKERCHSYGIIKDRESKLAFKGALDKYDIYLFIPNSIEDFKLDIYWNFQLILPMRFHFMRYFVNSIIFRVSHRLLYCVFIEVDFGK